MQEIYTVNVTTEDGKSLIQEKITGDYFSLSFLLARYSHLLLHHAEEIRKSEIQRGTGTGPSQPASSPSTAS